MKKCLLLFLGIGFLISACSQEKKTDSGNSNLLENLTVTIDTVRIDAKGEFLFLNIDDELAFIQLKPKLNNP